MTSPSRSQSYDVLIIGAGFAGIHQLLHYRKLGLSALILEAGSDLGGTWHWNVYPGARVDSELPIYQFSDPELWGGWSWSEKFPGWKEIQEYFKYVDTKMEVKRDVVFNSRVVSATWNDERNQWTVSTEDQKNFSGQFLSLCTGIGSKHYIPQYKGLESFNGEVHHSSRWPTETHLQGKRVGVIGTGSTGVQIIQEIAPIVGHLTVFQRTPNLSLPMRQREMSIAEQDRLKKDLYPIYFARRNQTFSGFLHDLDPKPTLDTTPEERRIYLEDKWEKGGFHLWLGSFGDLFTNQAANDETYAFWRKKTLERIADYPPELQEKLAPMKPPHPFGVKRPSLEQRYFEVYAQPNVNLVDISQCPIEEITPHGVKTSDGKEHELDVLVLATGFDMVTGGITAIDIRGTDGVSIKQKWSDGVRTYLGLATAGFPNMFWIYGPQSPSSFSNGPSTIELGSDWIISCIKHLKSNNVASIVPTPEAQEKYNDLVQEEGAKGLWMGAKSSWYLGSNIPGKKMEMLQFPGGVPLYQKLCEEAAEKGYEGFKLKRGVPTSA